MMMMRAVGYVRVSTEEQAKHLSPEVQEYLICDFARRMGYEIVQVFRDLGVSGSIPLSLRPAFQKLLEYCKLYNIKVIFALSLDRLTRNPEDKAFIANLLHKGFRIFTVYEHEISLQRLSDPTFDLVTAGLKVVRQYARARSKDTLHSSYIGHKFSTFATKFGTNKRGEVPEDRLREEIEKTVKAVLKEFEQGSSIRAIAQKLGIPWKLVRFILWLFGKWHIPPDICPRCGSSRTDIDPDYSGFRRCLSCRFVYPVDPITYVYRFESEADRLLFRMMYPPYIYYMIELRYLEERNKVREDTHVLPEGLRA